MLDVFRHRRQVAPEWSTCLRLSEISDLHEAGDKSQGWSHARAVTWAEYPYRFVLTEFFRREKIAPLLVSRIVPRMFELGRLSARRVDTGLVDMSRYYIREDGLRGVFHSEVTHWEEITEADKADYRESMDFALEHRLFAPNAEDHVELQIILGRAELDGVEPVNPAV